MSEKSKSRAKKGNPPTRYVKDSCNRGKNKGRLIRKPVRPNVLLEVIKLRNQGRTKSEIHYIGCREYHFRDNNPWENRYFKYIEENSL